LQIYTRKADIKDKDLLLKWFNKSDSLKYKIQTSCKISNREHEEWLKKRLDDKKTFIWIIEDERKTPIGQIRFEYSKACFYEVDIYVICAYRKLGVASLALKEVEDKCKLRPLRAIIKKNNNSSRLFFLKNNFLLNTDNSKYWSLIKK